MSAGGRHGSRTRARRGIGWRLPGGRARQPASLLARLRAYFLTGVIVTAPISITIFLVWQFVTFVDTQVGGLMPARYNPETYLPFSLPGLGLLVMLAFLTLVGMLTAGLAGRTLVRMGERLLSRMPVVRSVYGTLKQIFETVLAQRSRSFREVVLIEYPRRGIGAIGFVTGPTRGEIQARAEEELVNVFLPTTPNPTSGFLLFVPQEGPDPPRHVDRGGHQAGDLGRHRRAAAGRRGRALRRDRAARAGPTSRGAEPEQRRASASPRASRTPR